MEQSLLKTAKGTMTDGSGMSIPTPAQLHDEVESQFYGAHPDAPRPLDRHADDQRDLRLEWDQLAEQTAGLWANEVFVEHFPDAGYIDENHELFPYWVGWRDQILHGTIGPVPMPTYRMEIEVDGKPALQDVGAYIDKANDLANIVSICSNEQAILRQWRGALDAFVPYLSGPAADDANPDFAGAVFDYAKDYVIGQVKDVLVPLKEVLPGGKVFTFVAGLYGKYEEAAKAAAALKVRDFLTNNIREINDLDHGMQSLFNVLNEDMEKLLDEVRANPNDGGTQHQYLTLSGAIKDWKESAARRQGFADSQAYTDWLAAEWLKATHTKQAHPVAAHAVIRLNADWSVRDAKLVGSGAGRVLDALNAEHEGKPLDLWEMEIPRRVILLGEGEAYQAVARVDANGNPESGHTDFDGHWEWLHEQLPKLSSGWARTTNVSAETN